jgi:RNA polymerase sigma-70 factor (ECF subfamily)
MPRMLETIRTSDAYASSGRAHGQARRSEIEAQTATESLDERFAREALPQMRSLYATAYRLARNVPDAEDLVQETYLRALQAFPAYQADTNIRGWLFTILYRTRADHFRRAGRSPQTVEMRDEGPMIPPPQDELARGQEDVLRALDALPEGFRTAVVLRDVEDLSYDEIARMVNIPIGTVMSRIHRGRAMMRRALGGPRPA